MTNDKRTTVALIWGGRGFESEVSLEGAKNILPVLEENYNCLPIFIDKDGRWLYRDKEIFLVRGGLLIDGDFIKIDCALPLLHGDFGEDGRVQGALDCASVSYVGCDCMAGAVCRDKYTVKAVANQIGVPTLSAVLLLKEDYIEEAIIECEEKIGYPAFVKPTSLGSSVGASIAYNREELISALGKAFKVAERVMVEKFLSQKRELECGFLSSKGKHLFTKCGEILVDGFYSYSKKYSSCDVLICPEAKIKKETNEKIQDYSARLVRALGVRDMARIDFFLSGEELYFNEINTIPGMTETSLFPKMMEAVGIPIGELLRLLIGEALLRR